MWQPIEISFTNLFAHKQSTFKFKQDEMCLLIGENNEDEGMNSNGAGKSTIMEAICLAVTGNVYRDITKDQYIHFGATSCTVNLILKHSVTGDAFVIYREMFGSNKSSTLDLSLNNKSIEFNSENKMKRTGQDFIYETLGIERDDLLNYFIIGQENKNSFFGSTDTKQKEVISRFSNYDKLLPVIEQIKVELNAREEALLDKDYTIAHNVSLTEQINDIISELKGHDDDDPLMDLKHQLEVYIVKKEKAVQNAEALSNTLQSKQQAITALKKGLKPTDSIITLNKKLTEIRALMRSQDDVLNDLKEIKGQLAVRTGQIIKCPKCKWEFIPLDDMTAEEVQQSKLHVESELELAIETIERHGEKLIAVKKRIAQVEEIGEKERQLKAYQSQADEASAEAVRYNNQITRSRQEIKDFVSTDNSKLIKEQKRKIDDINKVITQDIDARDKLKEEIEGLKFQLFSFSKQFKTYMANKAIRTIQDITNHYLIKFGVEMRVLISGYTLLKNQELRDKIQVWVIKNGKQKVQFNSLSGGEKARLSLAGIICLNSLINNASDGKGLAFLGLDEFLEGLDLTGQSSVIKIMDTVKLTSVLIMHHTEDIQAKNKIFIKKQNGCAMVSY